MVHRLFPLACLICTCSVIIVDSNPNPLVWQIFAALNRNLDYLVRAYDEINEDCLLGIVLARGFLLDITPVDSVGDNVTALIIKTDHLYNITSSYLMHNSENIWALEYITQPKIWNRNITYNSYNKDWYNDFTPDKSKIINLFLSSHEIEVYAKFSDACLQNLANETEYLQEKCCRLEKACQNEFLESEYIRPGYLGTHKLLYIQIAKQRRCVFDWHIYKSKVKRICDSILKELRNIEYYGYFGLAFDLILEQIVLCGSEGLSEFFNTKWLSMILKMQKSSGCFSASYDSQGHLRFKRRINELRDGCADHTTGLGTAVLSLYLNYLVKFEQNHG